MAYKRSFSLQDVTSKRYKSISTESTQTTIIDGQLINGNQKNKLKVMNAMRKLNNNGSTTYLNPGATEHDQAVDVLETIGCCVLDMDSSFSLVGTQTDKESIENPNIMDSGSLKNKKNRETTATDKFSNPDDPFYQLDGAIPRNIELRNSSIKIGKYETPTIALAAAIAELNLSSTGTTLKYFKPTASTSGSAG